MVRNSVPSEALRRPSASGAGRRATTVVIGLGARTGDGAAHRHARARHQAPVARRSAAAGEVVLPVDDAHGGGVRRERVGETAAARRRDPRTFARRAWRRKRARAAERRGRRTRAGSRRAAGAAPRSRARAADRPACARGRAGSRRAVVVGARSASPRPGLQLGLDPLAGDRGEQVVGVHQPKPLVELEQRRRDRRARGPAR